MELADVIRVLFYLWLFVSIGVYVRRGYLKLASRGDAADDGGIDTATGATTTTASPSSRTDVPSATSRLPDLPRSTATPDRESAHDGDLVKAVLREEIERKRRAEAGEPDASDRDAPPIELPSSTAREGLFAPLGGGATDASGAPTSRPSVVDALQGVRLPCDLVPTLGGSDSLDPRRAVFVTSGHSPRVVGAELADELERLGYAIRTERDNIAIATREGVELRLQLYEDAANAYVGGERLFPHVANGSVAVVFTT